MKRRLALLLVLALCLTGGCTYAPHTILTVNAGSVSRIVLTCMEDSRELELVRSAEIRPLVDLLASVSVRYCGDCDGTEEHVYRLEVYVGDTQAGEICLNQDGSFCRSGKHRVPEKEEEGRQVLEACRVLLETAPEENALEEGCWEPVREPAETSVPLPAPPSSAGSAPSP